MTVFTEHTSTYRWYEWTDSDTTKISSINFATADYTELALNIIRISDTDAIVEGDILGEYRANTSQSGISRGDLMWKSASEIYQVSTDPRYNKLFSEYHLRLKRVK